MTQKRDPDRDLEYRNAEKAFNVIAGRMSVPATDEEILIARRFVDASRYRYRRPAWRNTPAA
jgi:hypothetical protein